MHSALVILVSVGTCTVLQCFSDPGVGRYMHNALVILVLLSLSRFSDYVSVFCVFIVLFKKASFSKSSADIC
jgi:hypothetical protein